MAKIIVEGQGKEVPDGGQIKEAAKELGVIFGCEDGLCGTCMVEVDEGQDNLSELTEAEKNMGVDGKNRLACQCRIKSGAVKLKY
ncbi:(2Fe-2S)-binding protein [Candidatus Woesearchaeota archaeon]|nr:(2Fe-2S)-binding protein [Candidatus Woesearchaeota archaeon]